jgi:hypothetical protein
MAWSFNPFTGNLDITGSSGAVVFEGEVATFADLPVTIGDPAVGAAFLVRESTGVWLVNRRQAGIYIRRNNAGLSTDWEYAGDYPVNSVNGQSGNVVLGAADVGAAAATHASTHHTGGTDALAAHQINGQTIFSVASVNYSADQTLPANRARQITISNSNAGGITVTLPTQAEGTLNGDTYVIVGGSTMSGPITVRGVANLSPLVYNTLVTITATGQQYRLRSGGGSGGSWGLIPVDTHTHTGAQVTVGTTANLPLRTGTNGVIEAGSFGTAAGSFCEGNDARLSDDRDPNLHAASHAAGGSDPVFDQDLNTTDAVEFTSLTVEDLFTGSFEALGSGSNFTRVLGDGGLEFGGTNAASALTNLGAAASGSITTSGLTQATARILGRTTASTGAIEEIQIGAGLSLSAGELSATGGSGGGEVRSDFVSPYTYTGLADAGTSESTASWTIRRSEFDAGGSFVATLTASAVQWANRLTASYT